MARHNPAPRVEREAFVLEVFVVLSCFVRATVLGCTTPGAGMGTRVSRALLVGYKTSGQGNRRSGLSTTSGVWNTPDYRQER